jgi:hypothetical protein
VVVEGVYDEEEENVWRQKCRGRASLEETLFAGMGVGAGGERKKEKRGRAALLYDPGWSISEAAKPVHVSQR